MTKGCFNSLQVRYKHHWLKVNYLDRARFQFLIGTLQTQKCGKNYRSGKKFQFLIGTLQTHQHAGSGWPDGWFQFLIGTLQTTAILLRALKMLQFQFLIGTLQTDGFNWLDTQTDEVSIPYRYATNAVLCILTSSGNEFQFLIGTLQTATGDLHTAFEIQFQFLIGTLQTTLAKCLQTQKSGVSIPYRYATNDSVFPPQERL